MPTQTYTAFANPAHKTQVQNAFKDVSVLLGKADSTLNKLLTNDSSINGKVEDARFTTWFGPPTAANLTVVKNFVHTILRQLSGQNTTLTNVPTSNTVAYMIPLPGQNFGTQALNYTDAQAPAIVPTPTIYIGRGFYTAPLLGKDSQVGTIIHELSHIVCSAEDVPNPAGGAYPDGFLDTYGETNCKWLAANHSAQALHNADNYLFYCCSFNLQ